MDIFLIILLLLLLLIVVVIVMVINITLTEKEENEYKQLKTDVLKELGFSDWNIVSYLDQNIVVNSRLELDRYSKEYFFEKHKKQFSLIDSTLNQKHDAAIILKNFLDREDNEYKKHPQYSRLVKDINEILKNTQAYRVKVEYQDSCGKLMDYKKIIITQDDIDLINLQNEIMKKLGLSKSDWNMGTYTDEQVIVKSRKSFENYDTTKYFKEYQYRFTQVENIIKKRSHNITTLKDFLRDNEYKSNPQYHHIKDHIEKTLKIPSAYRINVRYITPAGNLLGSKEIIVTQDDIDRFKNNPSLLMSKGEYNKHLKEQQKEAVSQKQHDFYEKINSIIENANVNREFLISKDSQERVDNLIGQLFDRTINSIKKIKTIDSEEWDIIEDFIDHITYKIDDIVTMNRKILDYYASPAFSKIKETCETLMSTQREFNEYIAEKVESISHLFGTRVVRNQTIHNDEYNYVRPYQKTITPFTAEVSATVFASAENNPMEYIVKQFYPNKQAYPEQIQKLYQLVEELETLRDAKQIIENYKAEYQQYLGDVPAFIMENDEAGFYSRLGFANIDESVLTVEYKFSYTSNGGMAHRSFTVPMTEENIAELIKVLESKLTASAFAKEQRTLMTRKLRESIKKRDNYTCCHCGNSIHVEPNLLLEIDHIIPVAKGGRTVEDNLQTLCWKCNRAKSDKILN